MARREKRATLHLDVLGLFLAGLIKTFLALFVAVIILGPGTAAWLSVKYPVTSRNCCRM